MSANDSAMAQYRKDKKITGETKWQGTSLKVGWELNQQTLSVETGESIDVDFINFVTQVGDAHRFWKDEAKHVLELSVSDESNAAVQIIQKTIQARIDRGEDLKFAQPTGRMLSSCGGGHGALCIVVSIGLFIFSAIGFYSYFTQPQKGGLGGSVMAALAAVVLFALGRTNRPRLDVFETELQNYSFFGKKTVLKYQDIQSLSCEIVRIVDEQGKAKRDYTKIAIDGPEGTIRYSNSGADAKDLEALNGKISERLVRTFWAALERGESIPFGAKAALTSTGLEQAGGSVIQYDDIEEVRTLLGEGKIQLFLKDQRKPALKIKSKEKNFYPCVELLTLLADPSITYKDYCGVSFR